MLVMLAYDVPENKQQDLLRSEFERLGGYRVQYSLYLFEGEPHECDRVIRYMRRVAATIPSGDVRLIPIDKTLWETQIIAVGPKIKPDPCPFSKFVVVW